ncbi:putative Dim1 family, Thioredoxin-like superfamily [Helianthus anomalus]
MSYLLPHLHSGWAVDQAILAEEERLVVIRFGHDWDETCMQVYQGSVWLWSLRIDFDSHRN